jgi:hypothetical protein
VVLFVDVDLKLLKADHFIHDLIELGVGDGVEVELGLEALYGHVASGLFELGLAGFVDRPEGFGFVGGEAQLAGDEGGAQGLDALGAVLQEATAPALG